MIRTLALIVSIVVAASAPAQKTETPQPKQVSVSSKGSDVRVVLHDMFKQAEKSFVLEPNVRFYLYLSLEKIEFEEALQLVCRMASLKIDVQNGIYFIGPSKPATAQSQTSAVKGAFETKPATPPAPKGKLPETVLNKRVTTRLDKVDFRVLISNLSQQTGVAIEVESSVPAYKLDAYLINTSLKYALETICSAAKLQYKFTDSQTIAITKPQPENRVTIIGGN